MTARISTEAAAVAILYGQMENEQARLLKLRKEQRRIEREIDNAQHHLNECWNAVNSLINEQRHVYTVADIL